MRPPFEPPEGWGYPALAELAEIVIPDAVSFVPATDAWWWPAGAVLLWLAHRGYLVLNRWRRDRYRREALTWLSKIARRVDGDELVQKLPILLKATAMHAYGRERTAQLSGMAWLEFLRQNGPPVGIPTPENRLLSQRLSPCPRQKTTPKRRCRFRPLPPHQMETLIMKLFRLSQTRPKQRWGLSKRFMGLPARWP